MYPLSEWPCTAPSSCVAVVVGVVVIVVLVMVVVVCYCLSVKRMAMHCPLMCRCFRSCCCCVGGSGDLLVSICLVSGSALSSLVVLWSLVLLWLWLLRCW